MQHSHKSRRSWIKGKSLGLQWLIEYSQWASPGAITENLIEKILLKPRLLDRGETGLFTSPLIADFLVSLVDGQGISTILDPTCGLGLLLAKAHKRFSDTVKLTHGCEINTEIAHIPKALMGNNATIYTDSIFNCSELQLGYDLIISHPTFEKQILLPDLPEFEKFKKSKSDALQIALEGLEVARAHLEEAILVWAGHHLSQDGTAIVIVPSRIFRNSKHTFNAVHQSGSRIHALIHLPRGSLLGSFISTHVVVLKRGEQGSVFIGEYRQNQTHLEQLVSNYKTGMLGPTLDLGVKVELDLFPGFEIYTAQKKLKRLSNPIKWPTQPAEEVILRPEQNEPSLTHTANSMYILPYKVDEPASLNSNDIEHETVIHLKLNTNIADPRFLVHWFNKSEIGRATLELVRRQSVGPKSYLTTLQGTELSIPSIVEQKKILSEYDRIQRIKTETKEQEDALWSGTNDTNKVSDSIDKINHKDNDDFENWIETLPFPIASILWRYKHDVNDESDQECSAVLLDFFEVLAAFIATIHLSAFMGNPNLWADYDSSGGTPNLWDKYGHKLYEAMKSQKFKIEETSFGYWKCIVEKLSKICRDLLKSEDEEDLATLYRTYGTRQKDLIRMLCSRELIAIVQKANQIRNQESSAHGSFIGGHAKQIRGQLCELLDDTRSLFLMKWSQYRLIQPTIKSEYDGKHHHYEQAKLLMGSHEAPFKVTTVKSSMPLERKPLYLFDHINLTGLRLLPFFRLTNSTNTNILGCYVFNHYKLNKGRFYYDSYHLSAESKIDIKCSEMEKTLKRIKQNPPLETLGKD